MKQVAIELFFIICKEFKMRFDFLRWFFHKFSDDNYLILLYLLQQKIGRYITLLYSVLTSDADFFPVGLILLKTEVPWSVDFAWYFHWRRSLRWNLFQRLLRPFYSRFKRKIRLIELVARFECLHRRMLYQFRDYALQKCSRFLAAPKSDWA